VLGEPALEQATRRFTGILQAKRTVAVGVQVAGQVHQVLVEAGDAVSAGDVLVRIDDRRLLSGLQALEAQTHAAQARLAELEAGPRPESIRAARAAVQALESEQVLAGQRLARRESLLEIDGAAQEDVDVGRSQVDSLQARLDGARAQLEELENGTRSEVLASQRAQVEALQAERQRLQIDLEDTRVLAPFDGTVQRVLVHAGAVIPAGQGVIELVESGALEARVGIPVTETERFLASDRVLRQGDQRLEVLAMRSLPEVDPVHRTVTWIFDLAAPSQAEARSQWLPGTSVQLELAYPLTQAGWRVPLSTITEGLRGMWSAYLIETDEQGRDVLTAVDLQVLYAGPESCVVVGALQAGDRLIADGVDRAVPGQRVEVLETSKGAAQGD